MPWRPEANESLVPANSSGSSECQLCYLFFYGVGLKETILHTRKSLYVKSLLCDMTPGLCIIKSLKVLMCMFSVSIIGDFSSESCD